MQAAPYTRTDGADGDTPITVSTYPAKFTSVSIKAGGRDLRR